MIRLKNLLLIGLMLLGRSTVLHASEESYFNELRGTSVSAGNSLFVTDEKFRSYTNTEWAKLNNISVKNYISFELNSDTSLFFYGKPFHATLYAKIYYYNNQSDTSLATGSSPQSVVLSINFDTAKGKLYKGIALFKFQDAYKFKVVIDSVSSPEFGSTVPPIFRLTGKTVIERQYEFSNTSTDVSAFHFVTPDQLQISWTPANYPGGEWFDLEWTTVDSLSAIASKIRSSLVGGAVTNSIPTDTLDLWFRNNATRITTSASSYRLNLAANSGYLLYRIRGVQYFHDNGIRYEGDWNYLAAPAPDTTRQRAIVAVGWHQSNLNWQYTASFAEEGKRKEVIQYFDGSLRNRQAVTLDNSNETTIIQENVYDAEGRVSASILPAPKDTSILRYFPAFNQNNSNVPYSFSDLTFDNCRLTAGILSSSSGAAQYYSSYNTFTTLHRDYIPSANGYPISVTEYTPDNTGRIASQGGVGDSYQPGTGHETRYFYGKPTQTELDRLFGIEAGNASHYLKNMVLDPNGQVSVSYISAEGKTIATALAGKVPDSLMALPSAASASTIVTNELIQSDDMVASVSDYSLAATATFTAPVTGTYHFTYNLKPQQLKQYHRSFMQQQVLCSTCYYDVKISVKDNCNNLLQDTLKPAGLLFDTTCTMPVNLVDSFAVDINAIGEYHLTYELVVSRNALEYYDSLNLVRNKSIRRMSSFVSEELRSMDFSNCFSSCETCIEDLGTAQDFIGRFRGLYKQDDLIMTEEDSLYIIAIYGQQLANCVSLRAAGCQKSPCQQKLDLLKMDVSPGGQYALFTPIPLATVPPYAINVLTKYSTIVSFPDEFGRPDTVMLKNINGEDSVRRPVNQLSLQHFILYWKSTWADSLVRFHPEYCYYQWCVSKSNYYGFDEMVKNAVTTGAAAVSGAYYSQNDYTALLKKDPFFAPANNGSDSTVYKLMRDQLRLYSRTVAGYSLPDKNILDVIKVMLYCKNQSQPWESCQVDDTCRSLNREWEMYKQLYFNAKEAFYERARLADPTFANCRNCYIGKDALAVTIGDTSVTRPGDGHTDTTYFNPQLNCINNCPDNRIYYAADRPGVSYFLKIGTRSAPPTPPSGYSQGGFYSSFNVSASDSTCAFFNVWVFIKDTVTVAPVNPPSSCTADTLAALYGNKIRRMGGYVNGDQFLKNGLSNNTQNDTTLQRAIINNTYTSSCAAKAEAWIASLVDCVNSGNPTTDSLALDSLRKEFIKICSAGSIAGNVDGASSAPASAGLTYSTFEQAITGILGIGAVSSTCAVELLSGAYPYDKQPIQTLKTINESDYDICTKLSQFRTSFAGSGYGNFYQYLSHEIGKGLTLTEEQVKDLERSCVACVNIINTEMPLPVAFISGRRNFIGCTTYDSLQTAFDLKFPGLSNGNYIYEKLRTNFFNQSLGFSLSFDDYQTFKDSSCPSGTSHLYDQPASPPVTLNNNACVANLFSTASTNAKIRYTYYIDSVRKDFREAYLNRCMTAQASASMRAELFEYHYTLYYYDRSGNLVKTIPPAGVVLLTNAQVDSVQLDRLYGRNDCYKYTDDLEFNGTSAKSFAHRSKYNFSTGGFAIEANLWLHNYNNQAIASYYDSAGKRGYRLFIKDSNLVFRLVQNDTSFYQVVTTNIASFMPLNQWNHLLATRERTRLSRRGYLIVNGNDQSASFEQQNFNASGSIDPADSVSIGLLVGADHTDSVGKFDGRIKQLRLYNRFVNVQEARQNYTNTCFVPSKQDGLVLWAPVNEGAGQIKDKLSSDSSADVAGMLTWIRNRTGIFPAHTLPTTYAYNSLNQTIQQETPDAGISKFWYDRLGRLAASQNSEQLLPAAGVDSNRYSYTKFDVLGRIIEAGEKSGGTHIDTLNTLDNTALESWLSSGHNYQVTQTLYDTVRSSVVTRTSITNAQRNLRKRIATTLYMDDATAGGYDNATHYTYDISGNVKTLWQEIGKLRPYSDSGIKRMDYDFDLISGKVNRLTYQPGKGDQFIYRYGYDAEDKITAAYSSRDGLIWSTDAEYRYYLHGQLARTELGTYKVQGIDYAYTLQGWLKGVNTTNLSGTISAKGDMGGDGLNRSRVSKDVVGFALHYNNDDYSPIATTAKAFAQLPGAGNGLFNGNISAMTVNLNGTGGALLNRYSYDQLHRLLNKNVYNGLDTNNHWAPIGLNDYKEMFTYDPNGNILTNKRNGTTADGRPLNMDALTYHYQVNTNRLTYVTDTVNAGNYSNDIDNQSDGNYAYDKIGNLIGDNAEGLTGVGWNLQGKVRSITKSGTTIQYSYGTDGKRVYKTNVTGPNESTLVYIREANGNLLALYKIKNDTIAWAEQQLYGNGRMGLYKYNSVIPSAPVVSTESVPTLMDSIMSGRTFYEVSNHIDNVLSVINDKKIGVRSVTDTTLVDNYTPELTNRFDYYSFGMLMPKRSYDLADNYSYGFNGKENDDDVFGQGNEQDYGMRVYDTRLGRFLSLDPMMNRYPQLTPYQFAGNTPIWALDLDGLEPNYSNAKIKKYEHKADDKWYHFTGKFTFNVAASIWNGLVSGAEEVVDFKNNSTAFIQRKTDQGIELGNRMLSNTMQFLMQTSKERDAQIKEILENPHVWEEVTAFVVTVAFSKKIALEEGTSSTVYRVQGGGSKTRILVGDYNLGIAGDDMLFVNVGQTNRAFQFWAKRGEDAVLLEFNVDKKFLDKLRKEAVPQRIGKSFPARPQVVDATKAPDQYGIPKEYFQDFLNSIDEKSVKVIKKPTPKS